MTWVKTSCETTQPSCLGPCDAHRYNATVQMSLKCSETLLNVPKLPVKTLHRFPLPKQPSLNLNKNPVLHIMLWQNFHWLQLSSTTQTTVMTNNKRRSSNARSSCSYLTECSYNEQTTFCKLSRLVLMTFIFCLWSCQWIDTKKSWLNRLNDTVTEMLSYLGICNFIDFSVAGPRKRISQSFHFDCSTPALHSQNFWTSNIYYLANFPTDHHVSLSLTG